LWRDNNGLQHKKRKESKRDNNRDKKIIIVKLIILNSKTKQKTKIKKPSYNNKILVILAKVLDLFLWCPILVWELGILGFVEKGAAPLAGQLEVEMAEGFSFPCFPWPYGPSITSRNSEVVSSDGWLVSSIWFLPSTG
jgi:hypothetical protein